MLHVALFVRVEGNVMEGLIDLGIEHSAVVHVNSEGLTPVQYADRYFQDDDRVIDLRNRISGDYYEHISSYYDEYLTELVTEAV